MCLFSHYELLCYDGVMKKIYLMLCFVLLGCASVGVQGDFQKTLWNLGFEHRVIKTDLFQITSYQRIFDPTQDIVIYIEGDGHAYVSRYRPSNDPTPHNPLGLKLAALDTNANLIYLARPCQYLLKSDLEKCDPKYWTSHRYAKDVLDGYLQILQQLENQYGTQKFHIVGYSGGGAIALLLAAHSDKVASVRTVAGNLSPSYHSEYHNVTPLKGLAPLSFKPMLKDVPQTHYIGGRDKIVPRDIAAFYLAQFEDTSCIKVQIYPDVSHNKKWKKYWKSEFKNIPHCSK